MNNSSFYQFELPSENRSHKHEKNKGEIKMDKLERNELFYKIADNKEQEALDLLQNEECINYQDSNGYSYLHIAVDRGMINVVRKLVERGADIEIRDKYGKTPLLVAISSFEGDRTIIDYLLKRGADKKAKTDKGISCEQIARMVGIEI